MAPILALLVVGTIEVGRYMYDGIEVGNAARAGVQYGAQSPRTANDTAGMANAARGDAHDITLSNVNATNFCSCYASGTAVSCITLPDPCTSSASDRRELRVQVIAQGTFAPVISFPGIKWPLSISRTATQQVSP